MKINIIKNKIIFDKEKIKEKLKIQNKEYKVDAILSGFFNKKNNVLKINTIHKLKIDPYKKDIKNLLIKLIKKYPEKILHINNEKLEIK